MTASLAPRKYPDHHAEGDRQEDGDERGRQPNEERIAAAVEQPHHDVAAVAVGAEEELAVRLEVLRADRYAVEPDDVLRLAVDPDRVGEVPLARPRLRHVVRPERRGGAYGHQQDEDEPEQQRDLVAPQPPETELPRPEAVNMLPLSLFLPGCRSLKGRFGCRLRGQIRSLSSLRNTLPDGEGAEAPSPREAVQRPT